MDITPVGMSSALSVAMRSIRDNYARYGRAAERIAAGRDDLPEAVVSLRAAELGVRFGIAVARAALGLQRSTIDLLV